MDNALKYEKPIVVFRVGALEEMIGDKGVLVEEISAEALTEAVRNEMSKYDRSNYRS